MKKNLTQIGRAATYLLRHGAIREKIDISPDGWVTLEDACKFLQVSQELLLSVVSNDDKSRFEVQDEYIRTSQGHSMIISRDAMESSWDTYTGCADIYHATNLTALPGIDLDGLMPQKRSHVHLVENPYGRLVRKSNVDVFLRINPNLIRTTNPIFISSNGVLLTRYVPRQAIVSLVPVSRDSSELTKNLEESSVSIPIGV